MIMILLPDYPDRVIREHKMRVEKIALFATFLLISAASWWLLSALFGSSDLLPRVGPISLIFISSLVIIDLIDYGPVQRSRIAVIGNICYPSILALSISDFDIDIGDSLISSLIYLILAIFLWNISNKNLSSTHSSKRWRGLTSIIGILFSLAIMYSISSEMLVYLVVISSVMITMIPDFLSKDKNHQSRKQFINLLDKAEADVLLLRSQGISLEQASSLLKKAREECWNDPVRGLELISAAQEDTDRTKALSQDLDAIRKDTLLYVEKAESIANGIQGPRKSFTLGDREAKHGSLREAELMYRHSKSKSDLVILHWQNAIDEINSAEELVRQKNNLQVDSLITIISSARDSLDSEDPLEAIKIASSVSGHLVSLESITSDAEIAIDNAEKAISEVSGSILVITKERLEEAKKSLLAGNSSLAKGLATSILRDIKLTSESMQSVQRGLRQKKKLIEKFPKGRNGDDWRMQLEEVESKAENGDWIEASNSLKQITEQLQSYEKSFSEALELYTFIESEWNSLRNRLESSNIKANDQMRLNAEKNISECKRFLDEGDIDSTLDSLGYTDAIIENLRRRI
jgi:competence protein ComGC